MLYLPLDVLCFPDLKGQWTEASDVKRRYEMDKERMLLTYKAVLTAVSTKRVDIVVC